MGEMPASGDWKYSPSHVEEGPSAVRHKDGWLVCATSSDDYARLIAAAPDMAESLDEAREMLVTARNAYPPDSIGHEWIEDTLGKINAALRKATTP